MSAELRAAWDKYREGKELPLSNAFLFAAGFGAALAAREGPQHPAAGDARALLERLALSPGACQMIYTSPAVVRKALAAPVAQQSEAIPQHERIASGLREILANTHNKENCAYVRELASSMLEIVASQPVEAGAPTPADDQLHSAIMNIPCRYTSEVAWDSDDADKPKRCYQEGHRDARHAAAELVNEYASGRESAAPGATPQVDALMAKWDDDGATRGPAFCELRDLAREMERMLGELTNEPRS